MDGGGGKTQGGLGAEVHCFALGRGILADRKGRPARVGLGAREQQPFQESHRLEEIEAARVLEKLGTYASVFSPVRGGHRFSTPSLPLTVATNFVNEFTVQ